LRRDAILSAIRKQPVAVGFDKFNEDKERERLRKMSDAELIREGKAARFMCSPATNFGKPPLEVYVVCLKLCKGRVATKTSEEVNVTKLNVTKPWNSANSFKTSSMESS
jgi:hypothetical protein